MREHYGIQFFSSNVIDPTCLVLGYHVSVTTLHVRYIFQPGFARQKGNIWK